MQQAPKLLALLLIERRSEALITGENGAVRLQTNAQLSQIGGRMALRRGSQLMTICNSANAAERRCL